MVYMYMYVVGCLYCGGSVCDISEHPFSVLYADVDTLCSLIRDYRLFWVLDFIHDTAQDLLEEHADILTLREMRVCHYISKKDTVKKLKAQVRDVQALRLKTARMLYEVLKPCRKLSVEEKTIVIENFNLNRIEK